MPPYGSIALPASARPRRLVAAEELLRNVIRMRGVGYVRQRRLLVRPLGFDRRYRGGSSIRGTRPSLPLRSPARSGDTETRDCLYYLGEHSSGYDSAPAMFVTGRPRRLYLRFCVSVLPVVKMSD
ncbi:hypothetical protein EVAR_52914_1 [Eumeta japonica]|uniref:Uncharacterized protein n=1 Tax=Eumeta variegata TaxID=151549 RepID=A0A4C1Y4F4_EUMVA|nr:hypothetical protein EVAR_52914_1 [Eumeta japonica]